jgi:polyhydroxyalkanoate synthase
MGPRPLPLHLALEAWTCQLSFAGLITSNSVSRRLKPPPLPGLPQLPDLLAKARAESGLPPDAPLDPVRLVDAVTAASRNRLETFATGIMRYHAHPARRVMAAPPAVWRHGAATLRDYGGKGPPVLVVPSLVNHSTVLDLAADRSFLRSMAAANLHTFLLDWDSPGPVERGYTISDYVTKILLPALEEARRRGGGPVRLVGYCMGGTLAAAAAVLAPQSVESLTLLAAPWDFHVGSEGLRAVVARARPSLEATIAACGEAPFDLIQTLFATMDPSLMGRKFRRFAALDQTSDEAARFVILEDWLNDPMPMAAAVARECLFSWYGENTPARGLWQVAGTVIAPARIACRSLAVIPVKDRIVPPASAQALARLLPHARIETTALGHIGMMASGRAPDVTYAPLIAWLHGA